MTDNAASLAFEDDLFVTGVYDLSQPGQWLAAIARRTDDRESDEFYCDVCEGDWLGGHKDWCAVGKIIARFLTSENPPSPLDELVRISAEAGLYERAAAPIHTRGPLAGQPIEPENPPSLSSGGAS
jgi:hypothetical protein